MAVWRRLESWLSWFPWYRRRAREADLERELRDHLELEADEQKAIGLSPKEAAYAAHRALGNTLKIEEDVRRAWGFRWLETLVQDGRYGLRMLRKSPGFTAVAVLTLALGIGANMAIFSLVNGILLQSLPYPDSNRLVTMFNGYFPEGAFVGFRDLAWSAQLAAFGYNEGFDFVKNGEPIRLEGTPVLADFFAVLGVHPQLGRTFRAGEDTPGQNNVVVLSDRLWRQRFGASPSVIGHSIKLNDINHEIIGVMPSGFRFPSASTELWIPLSLDPRNAATYWTFYGLQVVGRLHPGTTLAQSEAGLLSLLPRVRAMFPYGVPKNWGADFPLVPLQDSLVAYVRTRLLILFGGVALVLLIACVNVANLLLARAASRQREITLRFVLGASRLRLLCQFAIESILLSLAGGVLGFFLAKWAAPVLLHNLPQDTPLLVDVSLGLRVFVFTTGIALLIGLILGLLMSLRAWRGNMEQVIHASASNAGMSPGRHKLSSALLIGEVASAVIVIVCASLLARSLWKLSNVNPGFRTDHIVTELITPAAAFCSVPDRCLSFYDQVVDRAKNLPGIEDAALVNVLPLAGKADIQAVFMEGHPIVPGSQVPLAWENVTTPGYLNTMGIQLIAGRAFTNADTATSACVALMNTSMARRYWPSGAAIGKHITLLTTKRLPCTVVGVVNDVREFWLQGDPKWFVGQVYLPYAQSLALPHAPDMNLSSAHRDACLRGCFRRSPSRLQR